MSPRLAGPCLLAALLAAGCPALVEDDYQSAPVEETALGSGVCGDGVVDTGEECDGAQLCTPDCALDCSAFPNVQRLVIDGQTRCYAYIAIARSWAEARDNCAVRGWHLVTITSDQEDAGVGDLVGQFEPQYTLPRDVWIGATDGLLPTDETVGDYSWVNEEPFGYQPPAGTDTDLEMVNGACSPTCSHCLVRSETNGWRDRLCSDPYPSICELDARPM